MPCAANGHIYRNADSDSHPRTSDGNTHRNPSATNRYTDGHAWVTHGNGNGYRRATDSHTDRDVHPTNRNTHGLEHARPDKGVHNGVVHVDREP